MTADGRKSWMGADRILDTFGTMNSQDTDTF